MEYIHVIEAARLAGTSEKTIRRAVENGKLTAEPRVFKNQQLMIERSSLDEYISSRQPSGQSVQTTRLESENAVNDQRLAALEQQIQQIEKQNAEQQKHIEDLEQRLNWTRDLVFKVLGDLEDLEARTTISVSEPPAQIEKPEIKPVTKTSVTAKKETAKEIVFTLADFSIGWKDNYKSTAVQGDIQAYIELRPNTQASPGQYMFSGDANKVKRGGSISQAQKIRADALYDTLKKQVLEAMTKARWVEDGAIGTRKLYRKMD